MNRLCSVDRNGSVSQVTRRIRQPETAHTLGPARRFRNSDILKIFPLEIDGRNLLAARTFEA